MNLLFIVQRFAVQSMELAGKIFLNQIHGICYPLAYFGCEDEQEARRLLDTYEEEVTEKVNNN